MKFRVHRYKFTQKEKREGKKKKITKSSHSKREMNALHDIIDRLDIDEKLFSELEHILIEANGS